MRVLVATTSFPLPVRDGLRLQLAGLLRELSQRHEVVLVAVTGAQDDVDAAPQVCRHLVQVPWSYDRRRRVQQELRTLRSGRPVLADQVTSSALPAAVVDAVRTYRPDVLHLSPGWLAELVDLVDLPTVLAPLDASGPNWLADLDVDSTRLRRYLSRRELRRMLVLEREVYPRADAVVVVTERDASLLQEGNPALQPHVVTNGVDAAAWSRPEQAGRRDASLLVFSGAMGYPPNVAAAVFAAREVLPRVRRHVSTARLRIVGRDPSPEVLALAGDGVEVTGTVEDVRPHLWEAGAYVCPMRGGSGVKNKLMEALAAGAPCVVTPLATAGLDLVDGDDVLVGEDAEALADAAASLLRDPARAERLGAAGAGRARALSWQRAADGYEDVYEAAVRRHASR